MKLLCDLLLIALGCLIFGTALLIIIFKLLTRKDYEED